MEFSFEILHPIYDVLNDEVDVVVNIKTNQTKYHVTFVTYQRAQEIFKEHPYSLFSTTIFVERLTEEEIQKALKDVIERNSASTFFYPINEQARINLFKKLEQEKELEL